jgi:hypothetical protein
MPQRVSSLFVSGALNESTGAKTFDLTMISDNLARLRILTHLEFVHDGFQEEDVFVHGGALGRILDYTLANIDGVDDLMTMCDLTRPDADTRVGQSFSCLLNHRRVFTFAASRRCIDDDPEPPALRAKHFDALLRNEEIEKPGTTRNQNEIGEADCLFGVFAELGRGVDEQQVDFRPGSSLHAVRDRALAPHDFNVGYGPEHTPVARRALGIGVEDSNRKATLGCYSSQINRQSRFPGATLANDGNDLHC